MMKNRTYNTYHDSCKIKWHDELKQNGKRTRRRI